MKLFDRFMFYLMLGLDVVCAVLAAVSGKYLALIWIVSSVLWMCRCSHAEKSRDEWYSKWERAIKDNFFQTAARAQVSREKFELEIKNIQFKIAEHKRKIRRKRHFARLRIAMLKNSEKLNTITETC